MPPPYLTLEEFTTRTILPPAQIDRIETKLAPGWISANLESSSRWVDMYLAKRYPVPFKAPYPDMVRSWVARLVTARAQLAHGVFANDAQIALVNADADKAEAEIRQAADGQLGLIDLGTTGVEAGGVSVGGPRAYSESSPYVHYDVQRERARVDDSRRRGGGGGW